MNSDQMIIDKRVISEKRVPANKDGDDKSKVSDCCLRTRFGRMLRKPDRLAY